MTVICAPCEIGMQLLAESSVDAIVCDPPYEIGMMGRAWDSTGIAYNVPMWREALRVLKPGGHLLAFSATRTYHRMVCAIEDAGFEIRDQIGWAYGTGFPKSLDVAKAIDKMDASDEQERRRLAFAEWVRSQGVTSRQIDEATRTNMGRHYTTAASQPAIMTREHLESCRHLFRDVPQWVEREVDIRSVESRNMAAREVVAIGKPKGKSRGVYGDFAEDPYNYTTPATGAARQWQGWGTALKPAWEPIVVARKPLIGTVAENVLAHGTGGLNIDGCRVGDEDMSVQWDREWNDNKGELGARYSQGGREKGKIVPPGRWPANLLHDGSDEVLALFPSSVSRKNDGPSAPRPGGFGNVGAENGSGGPNGPTYADAGSAARFFYCSKASRADRGEGNKHETVKPTDLMRYLCRLVTPPGGLVLDPFTGSGSTGKAAILEGFRFIGFEKDPGHAETARRRMQP